MRINIPKGKKLIVVTGPESTGKTLLSNLLSKKLGMELIEEYARKYMEGKNSYTFDDVQKIGRYQINQETKLLYIGNRVILDTDIITSEIWAIDKFSKSLMLPISSPEKRFYLLCKPDIPYEPDPQREDPDRRGILFDLYLSYLNDNDLDFAIVSGERLNVHVQIR